MKATWDEIRARSASPDDKTCCGSCYIGYYATGYACSKHITAEERAEVVDQIRSVTMSEHPFFQMIKKDRYR